MPTLTTSDKTTLYFKDWGSGRPVVLSHGWPLSSDSWDSQAMHLANHGFRVIAFDRRGFGRSSQPWSGYDYDTFASDIGALVDALELKDLTLVGFSMGGGDVVRYAGKGQGKVKSLALVGSVVPHFVKKPDYPQGVDKKVFDDIKAAITKDRAQFFEEFWKNFYGGKASEGAMKQSQIIALQASLKGTLDCVTAFSETDFRPDVKKLGALPTLVIHGDSDKIVPFEATSAQVMAMLPHAKLQKYAGGPHGLGVTHADQLSADLLAFVKG